MSAILYAFVTVLAWGTWLAPSQNVNFKNQQIKTFYVAAANLALALLVFAFQEPGGLTWGVFWLPFVGGLVWAVSGFMAFTGTSQLGMARAAGIWTPLNVVVSILWGVILFGEFLSSSPISLFLLGLSLLILLAGVLLIIFAKDAGGGQTFTAGMKVGLWGALGAGVLWGSYFIPIKMSAASMWVAALPLSLGIFAGSAVLVLLARQPVALEKSSDCMRVVVSGILWGVGNYGMLLLVEQIGAGRGFTIAQLGVVVNGLIGVFILKDPAPKTRAAALTLVGCVLACVGGILLGSLK